MAQLKDYLQTYIPILENTGHWILVIAEPFGDSSMYKNFNSSSQKIIQNGVTKMEQLYWRRIC